MAKKKAEKEEGPGLDKMTVEQLETALEFSKKEGADEMVEQIETEIAKRKRDGRKEGEMKKKFGKLKDYKSKMNIVEAKYKPQEWIDMSPAFKETTKLPGIICGGISVIGGLPDSGKSTVAMEAAAFAQKQGTVPVFIITENKFSFERAEKMGVDFENAIVHNGVKTIEEGCAYIQQMLDDQDKGVMPYDLLFIWDSIGSTPSKAELKNQEEDSGRAMMETAKVLREKIGRYLSHRINNTRNEDYPYNATFIVINQAYTGPADVPGGPPKLVFYGGGGITYAASLIIRMGGIKSSSSKITAIKDGVEVGFAIRTPIVVEKNHVTNVCVKGKIICTDNGFIMDDKASIDEYKKVSKDGWELNYDKYWDSVSAD